MIHFGHDSAGLHPFALLAPEPVETHRGTEFERFSFVFVLVGVLTIAAATLIPLGLMLVSGGLPFIFGAVIFLLSGSWAIRFVYVKIPHTSPLRI